MNCRHQFSIFLKMQTSFRPCKKLLFIEWIMKRAKKYFYGLTDWETWIKIAQNQYF